MKKIIIYQVMPRLFGNQKKTPIFNGSIKQNGCGKFNDFTDGRLEEIKRLGITHIWYTGVIEHATQTDYSKFGIAKDHPEVVKGKAGSPYAIKDYYDVDPDLAEDVPNRMKEYQKLIQRTHKHGLKVVMDFVPNHVARQYHSDAKPKLVKDLGEDDVTDVFFSNQNNFYYLPCESFRPRFDVSQYADSAYREEPCKATGNDYFSNDPSIYDWYETVKLNYGVDYKNNRSHDFYPIPDTWIKMRDILVFWAKKKVDGFRCDMAEMVPADFWSWVIPQIKACNPEIIFIAETYDPSQYRRFIHSGGFDFLYDKVGLYDTLRSIMRNESPCSDISNSWKNIDGIQSHMLNFLENHDEQRIASPFFAGNAEKGKAGMIVASTINTGPIMVYNGQELGEPACKAEGFSGEDGRTTIFDYSTIPSVQRWLNNQSTEQETELHRFYTRLLNICMTEKAIGEGLFFDVEYANLDNPKFNTYKQFAYLRFIDNELLLIACNFEDVDVQCSVNIPKHAFDFLKIVDGQNVGCKDLLSNREEIKELSSTHPFDIRMPKNEGVIIKMIVETTK